MNPSILALSTVVPPYMFRQEEIADQMIEVFSIDKQRQDYIRTLYLNSAIQERYSVVSDFQKPRSEWHFWGYDYPKSIPGMSQRNDMYKKEAPKLAQQAAQKALQLWGEDPCLITHVISVSCTGVVAPGIEFELIQLLNLRRSVNRLGINFMGCFGAFKGLSVAQAFAKEKADHRILLICTELCSLHLQANSDLETFLANSLFSDGAAAVIVGSHPRSSEKPLWEILNYQSFGLENTIDKMAWEASDQGFLMRLSPTVPVHIGRHISSFANLLLDPHQVSPSACNWAIHPGGKSILQAVEKAMKLDRSQSQASWDTLAKYGNMSSSTFLFVLENLYHRKSSHLWSLGIGFGPGLAMEGILLRQPTMSSS